MEQRHYTREQIREVIQEAYGLVDEANLPPELRAIAFEKAVTMASAKSIERTVPAGVLLGAPRG